MIDMTIATEGFSMTTDGWIDVTPAQRKRIPSEVRDWVDLQTSMTEKVGQTAGTPVEVEVLGQATAPLHPDEYRFFNAVTGTGVVREVCLSAGGQRLLIARTVFTSDVLQTHPTIVKLGNRPLGALLFADGKPSPYSARQYTRLTPGAPLHDLVRTRHAGAGEGYWARRTLFELFGEPLLVTEIFLPELLAL